MARLELYLGLYKKCYNISMPKPIALDEDIQPISEFRANTTAFVEKVRETKRPIVITQHGRSAAVLLDVREYALMLERLEKLEVIEAIEEGIRQADAGMTIPHAEVKKRLLEKYKP